MQYNERALRWYTCRAALYMYSSKQSDINGCINIVLDNSDVCVFAKAQGI